MIAVLIASISCVAFLAAQVRTLRRRKRNLVHWEKDEPLEGVGDWD
jgi:Tfp pilus assembly protein PilV